MRDTYLFCPECLMPREAKRGMLVTKGSMQEIWYLGCGCSKPSGLL